MDFIREDVENKNQSFKGKRWSPRIKGLSVKARYRDYFATKMCRLLENIESLRLISL